MKEGSTSSGSPSTSSWLEVDNPQPVGLHGDTNQAVTVQGSVHVVLYWLVMSPWSVDNVDLLERLQRWALGMVTNIRGRTSAARPVEAGMISLSVRVKWGIRFEAKYSWLEITKLIEIESLFLQMWTPPFEQQNSMNTIMAFQECVKDVEVGCFRISGARVKCGRGP